MPRASYLQACLFQEEANFVIGLSSETYCGHAVIGEEDPHQLYAHYHEECGGEESIYLGGAKFWMPGWNETKKLVSEHGWRCGESTLEAYANFFWVLAESFEGFSEDGTE